jgi:diguanylate cyclase (GGDEF)-like protein
MPETNIDNASTVIDRLRRLISTTDISLADGKQVKVTISFGVAEFPTDGKSSDELLNKSDQRLYRAKAAGKNKVVHE